MENLRFVSKNGVKVLGGYTSAHLQVQLLDESAPIRHQLSKLNKSYEVYDLDGGRSDDPSYYIRFLDGSEIGVHNDSETHYSRHTSLIPNYDK